jgi:hypothetical protein
MYVRLHILSAIGLKYSYPARFFVRLVRHGIARVEGSVVAPYWAILVAWHGRGSVGEGQLEHFDCTAQSHGTR